jgi:hypothetical protein
VTGRFAGEVARTAMAALDANATVPKVTVVLTTTAANGYINVGSGTYYIKDKPWENNSTYVYSGYIWNRNTTNET